MHFNLNSFSDENCIQYMQFFKLEIHQLIFLLYIEEFYLPHLILSLTRISYLPLLYRLGIKFRYNNLLSIFYMSITSLYTIFNNILKLGLTLSNLQLGQG